MKTKFRDISILVRFLSIVMALLIIVIIAHQASTIHTMKETQEEQFNAHIASAAQSFIEYKETGYIFVYEDALMELHSASSIALLLKSEDEYRGVHGVILSIVGTYHSFPEDLALFTDELIEVLDDFETHHNVENLYTKLNSIDNRLAAMLAERLEKVE